MPFRGHCLSLGRVLRQVASVHSPTGKPISAFREFGRGARTCFNAPPGLFAPSLEPGVFLRRMRVLYGAVWKPSNMSKEQ